MRHAKSDWNANYNHDFDRPLSKRGHRDAARMSKWLAAQDLPLVSLISSTATRARETAEYLVCDLALGKANYRFEDKLYDCDRMTLLELSNRRAKPGSTTIILAHNPALDQTLEYLCRDSVSYTGNGKLMTTAAVAILSYPCADSQIRTESLKLKTLMRPRESG